MPKSPASKVAWVGRTAFMVFVVAVVLAGCSGADTGSGTQEEQAKANSGASPKANDDRVSTAAGREVMIEMVANDTGRDLEIDEIRRMRANGDIICDAEIESGKIRSCAYTPAEGFTGTDEFGYKVRDANGKTDQAIVYVRMKPVD
ncbi:MAG TPA: Ig-like domain-containing protein [Rubrobacter sp.]|nr:Ig-like domain-containing protein [Rubrobacter sp.]